MGEKLAMRCKEAKIQIAELVLQSLLLADIGQSKGDQLFYGWSPLVCSRFVSLRLTYASQNYFFLSSSIEYFIKSNFSLLFL